MRCILCNGDYGNYEVSGGTYFNPSTKKWFRVIYIKCSRCNRTISSYVKDIDNG